MPTTKKIAVLLLAAGLMLCDVGCKKSGPAFLKDLVPATGRVTLKGKALPGTTVMFTPAGGGAREAMGIADDKGAYELSTLVPGVDPKNCKGAIPGDYVVVLTRIAMPDGSPVKAEVTEQQELFAKGAKQFVPAKYTDPSTSTLKIKVAAPKAENNFDLE